MAKNEALYAKFHKLENHLNSYFKERAEVTHGLMLSLLSGGNILLVGPPGTAKTDLITGMASCIGGGSRVFKRLMTKFTSPEELYGPYSLRELQDNERYVRNTLNTAVDADFIILDEIFKSNSAVLNSLLMLMNEKEFINDNQVIKLPYLSFIGASNEIPEADDNLEAMYDRFALRFYVLPLLDEESKMAILSGPAKFAPEPILTTEDIEEARALVRSIEFNKTSMQKYLTVVRSLQQEGFPLTDRTMKNTKRVLQAEAFLNNHSEIKEDTDLDILRHVVWKDPAKAKTAAQVVFRITSPVKFKINEIVRMTEEDLATARANKKQGRGGADDVVNIVKKVQFRKSELEEISKDFKDNMDIKALVQSATSRINDLFKQAVEMSTKK